ncbi:hypothetical protein EDC01DRAFT_706673 [Geopyxis carbonaria]|nr:hypothetical protein EDC01DRAFT_706673 [Geopyxis carbonaria]
MSEPLSSRASVQQELIDYLDPLLPLFTLQNALIPLGATATHYDDTAASLEGFARPLWGLAALLAGGGSYPEAELWVQGLAAGTDPESDEYWGEVRDKDQRMVEMCPLGWWMCLCGPGEKGFWRTLSEQQQNNVATWLGSVNERTMPDTNWMWFRVFANLGLRAVGAPHSASKMASDLDRLDTFYAGGGWSRDGPDVAQLDYYSGPFAIQTSQLIYSVLASSTDPERAELYRQRAREYALDFVHYFDPQGRAIPFGRSTTYRFAMSAFWGVLAYADVELPAPLGWGAVRGLLLRNLRWWAAQKPRILAPNGTLTIGYAYPNMFFTENYNSAGSPYWAMMAFIALAVPASHPFWTAEEEPYPLASLPAVAALHKPGHIVSHRGGHTFLLSSGQHCSYPLRATHAKYGKFAYSSSFAFSVPTGGYMLDQHGLDSTLGLSLPEDAGETWKTRRIAEDAEIMTIDGPPGPVLHSLWRPWPDVTVHTWLLPPTAAAPCWHLRVHRIHSARALRTAEGGWSLYGQASSGRHLPPFDDATGEGTHEGARDAFAVSSRGAVGVRELVAKQRRGGVLRMDANANLMEARTVLPTLYADLRGADGGEQEEMVMWVTGVFAMPASVRGWQREWRAEWERGVEVPGWVTESVAVMVLARAVELDERGVEEGEIWKELREGYD